MEYNALGRSGLKVSIVGLGGNNFGRRCDEEQTAAVVHRAMDLGITLFDTADVYGERGRSEEYVGKALKGVRREAIIATKIAGEMGEGPLWRGGSRRYIYDAVTESLRRLGTDYIDLLQMHFPDPSTPIEETMRALDDLVRGGVVRYIGCSNYSAAQVVEAQWAARAEHLSPFISAQNQYNLLNRGIESELVPVCERYGLGIIPYFPLASGFLTGKYSPGEPGPKGARLSGNSPFAASVLTERNFAMLEGLAKFAQEQGHSMTDLAIGWLVSQPAVNCVIAGATQPEQVEANVRAAEWKLSADEKARLAKLMDEGAD